VFKKLISRFQEKKSSDHPLASDAGLNALMADIPQSDPARLLFDIDEWLAGMEATVDEIGPTLTLRALARLDQFSRAAELQLLWRYLSTGQREYMADSAWSALDVHAGHLFRCYRLFLNTSQEFKTDDDKLRMARCAARTLMAWSLRKKLQRFRYRTPGADLWQEAHDLLQVLNRMGLLKTRVVAYRNEQESTPLGEYLIGLYLEFAPFGNVVPQQLEFIESFLRSCGDLDLTSQPTEMSTHCIDLGAAQGPQRLKQGDSGGGSMRYCAVRKLRGAVMKLAAQVKKPKEMPDWVGHVPATSEQMESAVLILMTHWAQAPPHRSNDRVAQQGELRIVLGFGLARRMIAAAHFARMGRSFEYEGEDVTRMFDESRFGTVAAEGAEAHAPAAKPAAPTQTAIDILRRLETGGDQAQMETWIQVDYSATGIGAVVPAVLPRHRIGGLICLREADGLDWRLGLIRRIGRDAANRPSVGIETLGWPSICALAKPVGEESAWTRAADGGGHGWSDAIIVSEKGDELILPAGTFIDGIVIDVRSESGLWRLRLESLLDRGPDYDRIQFTRIS
jgi:hypothetical protein